MPCLLGRQKSRPNSFIDFKSRFTYYRFMEGTSEGAVKTPAKQEDHERGAHTISPELASGVDRDQKRSLLDSLRRLAGRSKGDEVEDKPERLDAASVAAADALAKQGTRDAIDSLPPQPQQRDE